jgi:hypothetical protein
VALLWQPIFRYNTCVKAVFIVIREFLGTAFIGIEGRSIKGPHGPDEAEVVSTRRSICAGSRGALSLSGARACLALGGLLLLRVP